MKLGNKIIVAAIASIALAVTAALIVQKHSIENQGIEMLRSSMHATLVEAESVRESVSQLGAGGAFDRKKLLEECRSLRRSPPVRPSTRPCRVVAAWEAAGRAAESKVTASISASPDQARNSKNLPTPMSSHSSTRSRRKASKEYFKADRFINTIVLARPVTLTQDCMACHGDPATSPTKDGKDIVGFAMENWKVGEVHGTFILKTDFSRIDASVSKGMATA